MLRYELRSNTRLRVFCGKWIEALFSYDVDVWDEYVKVSTNGGPASASSSSRSVKVDTTVTSLIFIQIFHYALCVIMPLHINLS